MGYYLKLRSQKNITTTREDLVARLKENNIPEHPDYDDTFMLYLESDVGMLTIYGDKYLDKGELASIRISWGFDPAAWLPLIALAEKLDLRLYDLTTIEYVTKDRFRKSFETHHRGFGKFKKLLGETIVLKKSLNEREIVPFFVLQIPIKEFCLSVRIEIALIKKLGLKKLGEILTYSEKYLLSQTNIGKNGIKELKETLLEYGVILKK